MNFRAMTEEEIAENTKKFVEQATSHVGNPDAKIGEFVEREDVTLSGKPSGFFASDRTTVEQTAFLDALSGAEDAFSGIIKETLRDCRGGRENQPAFDAELAARRTAAGKVIV